MRRLIILVLAIGLTVFITAETMPCPTAMRHRVGHGVAQSPQRPDILVVDFTKKPSANPYQELYEKLLYPTVRIQAGFSTGSGVVIGDYILTAAHVVNDQSEVTIEVFYPALCELGAFVVITDTDKDLALIKPSRVLPYKAQLAPESYTPYIFTPVYTVGCSLGSSYSCSS
ncbi:MAG: trypsin-like peptidase domain-containing protein [Planctomycetes bacterium]|nr:trypsin-like peptidase domain-containing protein [Planctomycetota bacterium]